MGMIFYLMGKSSSGKDTIFKALTEDGQLGLKHIVPYTTRPIRDGERDGVEYHFTDDGGVEKLRREGRIIELRVYHTCYGDWTYFTAADDGIDLAKNDYLMIGTPESYERTRGYFGEEKVCPLLIELDDGIRLQRALDREKLQDPPHYEEMCRRFLADSEDFAEEQLRALGLTKRFCNEDLDACIGEIREYITQCRSCGAAQKGDENRWISK